MDERVAGERRPAVFRQPGSFLYADNCRELQAAARRGEVELTAWTRGSYPGQSLGEGLPGICTVGFWDAKTPQSWGLARHCNEGFKVAYVARGSLDLEVDGRLHHLAQGQFLVIRPWQLHAMGTPSVGPNRLIWTIFDVGVRRPNQAWSWPAWVVLSDVEREHLEGLLAQNEQPVWDARGDLARAFEALPPILQERTPADGETRLKVALNALFIAVLERLSADAPKLDPRLATSQHTVAIFLRRLPLALSEPWTLDSMAEECGLSRTRFADYCRLLTNMTPMQHLQHLRLERAATLLSAPERESITEIAYRCGFNSSQYFSNAYRRRFGHPPRELRRVALG
jgi:AraC family L-rhamnose operon regulatory protein RhaS